MKHSPRLNPANLHIPPLDLLARGLVEGYLTGLHRSPFHGYSSEFREHKMYTPGESIRFIDWKVYARTGKLYIKQFDEETNMQVQLVLDVSPSMYYPSMERFDLERLNKIGFAVVASAVLSEILRRQRDATGLSLYAGDLIEHMDARVNPLHRQRLLGRLEQVLRQVPERGATRTARSLHLVAERLKKRSLVVVFSDFWDYAHAPGRVVDALKYVRFKSSELIVFHIRDRRTEDFFDFPDRPTRFKDLENGREISLHPREIREAYRRQRKLLNRHLREEAYRYHFDYVPVDTATPYEQIMAAYLQKRLRMH